MATIGRVVVSVYAKTEGLRKSLAKAGTTIKAFAKNAIKTLKTISIGVGAGAVVAVTAIIATVNKYAAEIDKLAKESGKLGITVAALQKLQYQATLSGVSAEKLGASLQRMVRGVSEAASGTGTAKKALQELGLSAEDLNNLSTDQKFYAISEAMKSIGNQGDKVRIAVEIFGRSGADLINTFNSNLQESGSEFEKLGITVSQSSAKMVEAYNDSKAKLGAIFSGFGIQLTAQLAEPFQKLIQFISKIVVDMGGMEVAAKRFASFMVGAIKASISAIQSLIAGFVKLENIMLRIENVKLLPAIAAEAVASQVAGTPGVAGRNTQQAFDNEAQIAKNNAALKDNSAIKALDKLLLDIGKGIESKVEKDIGVLVRPEHHRAFNKAANDATIMADSSKKAAVSNEKLATAATKAAEAVNPKKKVIETSSFLSELKGGGSGLSAFSVGGKNTASNVVGINSARNAINQSAATASSFMPVDVNLSMSDNVKDLIKAEVKNNAESEARAATF